MRASIRTLGLVIAATTAAGPTFSQTFCADRAVVTERLKSGYGESFAGGGLRNQDSIFEVWMSQEKGTWTLLMTMANGRSCVMASGTDWRMPLPSDAEPAGVPG